MKNKEIKFKIGRIDIETTECRRGVAKATQEISDILKHLEYYGTLREKNSRQLDIHFDEAVLIILKSRNWLCEKKPLVDMSSFGENWGNLEADFITMPTRGCRAVVEIEKANKKTMWFDFIKLWMFIESKQAKAGILICPQNYAHTHGVWNLYEEACRYKRYLKRFAGVKDEKVNQIGIVGYQQMIYIGGKYTDWTDKEFNRVKKRESLGTSHVP